MRLITACLVLLLAACKSNDNKEELSMNGVYTMLSQRVFNDKEDTTYTSLQQLKIFTPDIMMYANFNPKDSVSGFGIGSYTIKKDTVIEDIFFNASDTSFNNDPGTFTLIIEKTSKGFKQVIPSIKLRDETFTLHEDYTTSTTDQKTAIDGAWRQVKSYSITGTDTITNMPTQYKVYYGGYIIWGNVSTDSLNKSRTLIGYGKFEMPSENKVKEIMMVSTLHLVRGNNFELDINMNGADEYTQIIKNTDGSRSVEIYKRVK